MAEEGVSVMEARATGAKGKAMGAVGTVAWATAALETVAWATEAEGDGAEEEGACECLPRRGQRQKPAG